MSCGINRISLHIFLISVYFLLVTNVAYALNPATHRAINEHVSKNSISGFTLNAHLKLQLNMAKGYDEKVNSKEAFKWIADGGEQEDSMGVRSFNHFHNPLTNTGLSQSYSALIWATLPVGAQNLKPLSSWNDVRYYYERALTEKEKKSREEWFARTFQGVGQIMHLVEDMSVPAHTPNHQSYQRQEV